MMKDYSLDNGEQELEILPLQLFCINSVIIAAKQNNNI